jgi:hypothetical protein
MVIVPPSASTRSESFAQAVHAFLHGKRAEGLSRPQLVALALTPCRGAALAEDPPQVFATGLVGGHAGERRVPCLHADDYRGPRSRHRALRLRVAGSHATGHAGALGRLDQSAAPLAGMTVDNIVRLTSYLRDAS